MSAVAVRPLGTLAVVVLVLLSVPIGLYAFGFQLSADIGDPSFKERFARMPTFAAMHVLGGGVALLIGGFQFSGRLRARALELHRWIGRTYLVAVLVGSVGGFMLATMATGGLVARVGFALLAVLWLYSAAQAYLAVRRGDLASHRQWMIRNFAFTFAAVTLRIYLGALTGALGYGFDEAYATVAWLCWVPNLVVAEWFLSQQRIRRTRAAGAPKVEPVKMTGPLTADPALQARFPES